MIVAVISVMLIVQVSSAYAQETSLTQAQGDSSAAAWPPMDESWNYWWSYSAISGPAFWGLMNPAWFMCDKGKRQSPIDIRTENLIFDPSLTPLKIDNNLIWVSLYNDGHAILINSSDSSKLTQSGGTNGVKEDESSDEMKKANNRSADTNTQQPESALLYGVDLISPGKDTSFVDSGQPEMDSAAIEEELGGFMRIASWLPSNLADKLSVGKTKRSDPQTLTSDAAASQDLYQQDQQQPQLSQQMADNLESMSQQPVRFSGAGLAYVYQFERVYLRFGSVSGGERDGSEHQLNGRQFAAELQILTFNTQLYSSFQEASLKPLGLMAISVLIGIAQNNTNNNNDNNGDKPSTQQQQQNNKLIKLLGEGDQLFGKLDKIKFRGASSDLYRFNVSDYLPAQTDQFVTYEGSLTVPGCYETVTWIILNKPLYITSSQLDALRSISADDQTSGSSSSGKLIAGNTRPIQPLNGRLLRTNIRPSPSQENSQTCQRMWARYEYKTSPIV